MKKNNIIVLVLLCIAAVSIGVVIGYRRGEKKNGMEEQEMTRLSDEYSEADSRQSAEGELPDAEDDSLKRAEDETVQGQDDGTDPEQDGDSIPEDEEQQETSGEKSEMTQMSISIMGDSISTFKGYIPAGYHDFFPDNGAVTDVNDTWWKSAVDDLGMKLCVNASSSGSTCAGDSTSKGDPQSGCDDLRVNGLTGADGETPDIIIVYMGTNDLLESIPLGSNDGTVKVSEGNIENFSDAYTLMLDKLHTAYPDAAIYCCTITCIGGWGEDGSLVEFVNGASAGLRAQDYNACIKQIAANKGASVIDLYNCGITLDNLQDTTADGVHPTPLGMSYIAAKVKASLAAVAAE
jgi:lysophospholipase L1-like esterase